MSICAVMTVHVTRSADNRLSSLLPTNVQVACGSGLERICRFLQSDPCEAHLDHSPYVCACRHAWAVKGLHQLLLCNCAAAVVGPVAL
jgi:hypothetical protein